MLMLLNQTGSMENVDTDTSADIDFSCDTRLSDSPFIERIWYSYSEEGKSFTSIAASQPELVVTKYRGKTTITVRGPEIRATAAYGLPDAEFFGIQFKPGTFMPLFPPKMVMDRADLNLPDASGKSFWLNGSAWQFPDFDNMDTFINRLVREGLLVHDPIVHSVLTDQWSTASQSISLRSIQRRFLQATGLTHSTVAQIKRARYATLLLKEGVSILDTVDQAGYADQPHLTRSLKHYIGFTPAQLSSPTRTDPLSFLFKTLPF